MERTVTIYSMCQVPKKAKHDYLECLVYLHVKTPDKRTCTVQEKYTSPLSDCRFLGDVRSLGENSLRLKI